MLAETTVLTLTAGEWTAVFAAVTAFGTIGIFGAAVWVGKSESRRADSAARAADAATATENRARVFTRREQAIQNASTLYVEPLYRDADRIGLRATGAYEFTDVKVQWLTNDGLLDCHEGTFSISPARDTIPTVRTPPDWNWPPSFIIRYYDTSGRYFVRLPDRPPILVMDPTETDDDRRIAGELGRPHWLPPGP